MRWRKSRRGWTTLEGGATSATATPAAPEPAVGGPRPLRRPAPDRVPPPAPVAVKADPARKAALAAIEMPATGDAVEDAYTYGFRLYTAKLYPEAQVRLKDFTAKQPVTQRRWSYAQNLLGRAYLDEGKPALASVAFTTITKRRRAANAPREPDLARPVVDQAEEARRRVQGLRRTRRYLWQQAHPRPEGARRQGRADAKCAA